MKTYRIDMSATYLFSVEVDAESLEEAKALAVEEIEPDLYVSLDAFSDRDARKIRMSNPFGGYKTGKGTAELDEVSADKAWEVTP